MVELLVASGAAVDGTSKNGRSPHTPPVLLPKTYGPSPLGRIFSYSVLCQLVSSININL